MAAIFVRTIIIYITLIAIMRFLGKRQIGQMQISELITAFLLSELASQPLANASVPLVSALIPILTLKSHAHFRHLPHIDLSLADYDGGRAVHKLFKEGNLCWKK